MTPAASFSPKVNYALRPGKASARRMVVEALARLGPIAPVEQYRYIGMGSIYFRDFELIHRRLGIDQMVTIEGDPAATDRVRFNLPLSCIEPMMDRTGDALPKIRIEDSPHIVWLDYESTVDQGVLSDVEEVARRCAAASVLIVTANAGRPRRDRDQWLSELGDDRPEPRDPGAKAEYALLAYRVLRARIDDALDLRNSGRPREHRVAFRQMFHMIHADGATMLTVGGAFVPEARSEEWESCGIDSLEYARSGDEALEVNIPFLTRREMRHLLAAMPGTHAAVEEAAVLAGIPLRDAEDFAAVYRYAPLFVEAEDW